MGGGSGGSGPLDTMRSLEQFLPGDQPRGFMGPDSGHKGKLYYYPKEFKNLISFFFSSKKGCPPPFSNSYPVKGILLCFVFGDTLKMISNLSALTPRV